MTFVVGLKPAAGLRQEEKAVRERKREIRVKTRYKNIFAVFRQIIFSRKIMLSIILFVCGIIAHNTSGLEKVESGQYFIDYKPYRDEAGSLLDDLTPHAGEYQPSAGSGIGNESASDLLQGAHRQEGSHGASDSPVNEEQGSFSVPTGSDEDTMENNEGIVYGLAEEEGHSHNKYDDEYDEYHEESLHKEKLTGRFIVGEGMGAPSPDRIPSGIFTWPLEDSGIVTGYLGLRSDPFTAEIEYHSGADIATGIGASILAVADGVVSIVDADSHSGWGQYIKITHEDGYETLYAHCSIITVEEGDIVQQGQIIAHVGSTGRSKGPHLHWEVFKDGVLLNPLSFFVQ